MGGVRQEDMSDLVRDGQREDVPWRLAVLSSHPQHLSVEHRQGPTAFSGFVRRSHHWWR
jgi:hypothetical protein